MMNPIRNEGSAHPIRSEDTAANSAVPENIKNKWQDEAAAARAAIQQGDYDKADTIMMQMLDELNKAYGGTNNATYFSATGSLNALLTTERAGCPSTDEHYARCFKELMQDLAQL